MLHKRIRLPKQNAVDFLNELGKIEDGIEFIDLNKNDLEAKKNFLSMIKRCEEAEKKISTFENLCGRYSRKLSKYKTYSQFIRDLEREEKAQNNFFDTLEHEVIEDEKTLLELINSHSDLVENLEILEDKKAVLEKVRELIQPMNRGQSNIMSESFIEQGQQISKSLNIIAGVVSAEDLMRMKRTIFRVSKGRAYPTFFEFYPQFTLQNNLAAKASQIVPKKIYIIFYQGTMQNLLLSKILKVCEIFNASRFEIPEENEFLGVMNGLNKEIEEKIMMLKEVNNSSLDFIRNKVGTADQPSRYEFYRQYFKKEKLIYYNLNKCKVRDNFIDGEVFVPEESFKHIQLVVQNIAKGDEDQPTVQFMSSNQTPQLPTYFKTNEFTWVFQEIVNTYGVPRYKEINPTLFNIVTFPFLFGVMFGDIAHGLVMFIFSLYLVLNSNNIRSSDSMMKPFLRVRYLLLMMGFFALYIGCLYNDFTSIPLPLSKTCYVNKFNDPGRGNFAEKKSDCTYPFGFDHKWYSAENELTFFNSFKMKVSVIFGVLQMVFGIFLKGLNNLYFNSKVDFFCEFIPQILFMVLVFGYMDAMIIIKWLTDWTGIEYRAPNITSTILDMFMGLGSLSEFTRTVDGKEETFKKPLYGDQEGNLQQTIQVVFLLVAVLCIPIILLPKPLIKYYSTKGNEDNSDIPEIHDSLINPVDNPEHADAHHENEPFSDVLVHQVIETIEFVLGSVSNTASYLRLWALSLAHSQLSKVFFDKAIRGGLTGESLFIQIPMFLIGFMVFANITFGILLCMDLLECFLHTLRLHWVEYQNKFYKADGFKFEPFSFKKVIQVENED